VNATMGGVLDALGKRDEALPYYEKALSIVQSVHPNFQRAMIPGLEKRVAER